MILFNRNCTKFTVVDTGTALDTLGAVDNHRSQFMAGSDIIGAGDGLYGAALGALAAANALLAVDNIAHEFLADTCTARLVDDVFDVFIPEVVEGGENGVGRGLTKAAEGGVLDDSSEVAELLEVFHGAATAGNLLKDFAQALVTDTAG